MVVIGCGQLGSIFARIWQEREPDDALVCTVRREASRERLPGLDVRVVDLLVPSGLDVLAGASRVLVSVVGDEVWSIGVANLVAALSPDAHVVHLSSTGIYVENDGGEVDEDSVLLPDSPLVAAEATLRGVRSTILRCAGLVGETRGPQRMIDRIAGTARPDGWLNLVRMDDVAELIAEAFAKPVLGTFNVSGSTLQRSEFYDPLIAAAGLKPVEWASGSSGRRVRCDRLAAAFEKRPNPVLID